MNLINKFGSVGSRIKLWGLHGLALLLLCLPLPGLQQGGLAQETKTVVFAISPRLDLNARKEFAQAFFDSRDGVLQSSLVRGKSRILCIDGYTLRPVADFMGGGNALNRQRANQAESTKLINFLKSPGGAENDAALDIPGLAQALPGMRLEKAHVILVGNPMYLDSRKNGDNRGDEYFDMSAGFVPGHGLFRSPRDLSVYSVEGREKNLTSIAFSFVIPTSTKFLDSTHEQATKNTWSLYTSLQGGVLVGWWTSTKFAIEQAIRGDTKPLAQVVFDPSEEDIMLRKVADDIKAEKKVNRRERPTNQHVNRQCAITMLVLCTGSAADEVRRSPAIDVLKKRGAKIEMMLSLPATVEEFEEKLASTTQLWVWAGANPRCLPADFRDAIVKRNQAGLALYLLADNSPYVNGVREILAQLAPGSSIEGDYEGDQIITAAKNRDSAGFDKSHPIFMGIINLYEGNTVSSPSGGDLVTIARASNGLPLLALVKREPGKQSGPVLVSGGFTSLFQQFWNTAGTERFAQNVSVYLAGVEK